MGKIATGLYGSQSLRESGRFVLDKSGLTLIEGVNSRNPFVNQVASFGALSNGDHALFVVAIPS